MKAQITLCQNNNGFVDREPIHYNENDRIEDLIEKILLKTENYYGPGCYTPLGKSTPNITKWLEIRAYHKSEDAKP